jgi:RimJ/RimL family protein N-acetyltransferase
LQSFLEKRKGFSLLSGLVTTHFKSKLMTKNTILETKRLIMKPIETSDTNGLFRLDNNANVMKYLGNKIVTDIQYIHDKIDRIQNEYQKYNSGRFSVFFKRKQ